MSLEGEMKREVMRDYLEVCRIINASITEDKINFRVKSEHWLHPTIKSVEVPFEDPQGEYAYFSGIRSALEEALLTGKISTAKGLPYKSPVYIAELRKKGQ